MKKYAFLFFSVLLFASCSQKVEISVFNNSEVDRVNEMVEICFCQLNEFDASKVIVLNNEDKQIPCQILYKGSDTPKALIFPVTLKAGKETSFFVKEGTPDQLPAKTSARYVAEYKGDMSWENDRIGFRMYGPGMAGENPGNGVDVWLKRTNSLVFDKWYQNNLSHKTSFQNDNGEGLDCYEVARTLGAGGICPYSEDSLWIGRCFDRYKVLDNGPIRSSFILYYDSIRYKNKKLKAELVVTLDAGSNLNEARIKYFGDTTKIRLASGIFLHDSIRTLTENANQGFIAYAEDVFAQNGKKVAAGRCFTGVVFPTQSVKIKRQAGHSIGICDYVVGDEFLYYFGAGWNKHGFKKDIDWLCYVADKRTAATQPLKIRILK